MRLSPQLSVASVPPAYRFPRSPVQRMTCLAGLLFVLCAADTPDCISTSRATGAEPQKPAPTELFNGTDLTGWEGSTDLWTVSEGMIVGRSSGLKQNEFLSTTETYGDFELSLEFRLESGKGNSGIQFRSSRDSGGHVKGFQADAGKGWWGKLYEEHGRGLLFEKSGEEHVQEGEWNEYRIVAVGPRIRTYINGKLCTDLNDPQGAKAGIIAFQIHSGGPMEVRFKDLELQLGPVAD